MRNGEADSVESRRWLLCDACGLLFAQPIDAPQRKPPVCRACQSADSAEPPAPVQGRESFDGGWLVDLPGADPKGPLTLDEVKSLIRAEGLPGSVRVWSVGLLDWPRLDQLPVFKDVLGEARERPQTAPIPPGIPPVPTPGGMDSAETIPVPAAPAPPVVASPAPAPSPAGAGITARLRAERVVAEAARAELRDAGFRAPTPGDQIDEPSSAAFAAPPTSLTTAPSATNQAARPRRLAPAIARPVQDLLEQAQTALLAQRLPVARRHLLRALQLAPAFVPALRLMGLHDLCTREIQMAEVMFEKAQALDPEDAETLLCLGVFHWQRGAHARARRHWRRALIHDPELKSVVGHGGAGHAALELFPDALAGFQALVRR